MNKLNFTHYIKEWSKVQPKNIAFFDIEKNKSINYVELENLVHNVSRLLTSRGILPNDIVGFLTPKSILAISSLYSTLRLGAAYVCYKPEEITQIFINNLKESNPKLIVTTQEYYTTYYDCFESINIPIILTNNNHETPIYYLPSGEHVKIPDSEVSFFHDCEQNTLSYIIFTSGSTGYPKGVKLSCSNVLNYIDSVDDIYKFTSETRQLSGFPLHFDAINNEIFNPIATGSGVYFFSKMPAASSILAAIDKFNITDINFVASTTMLFAEYVNKTGVNFKHNLKTITFGAERSHIRFIKILYDNFTNCILINGYGPTELTNDSSFHILSAEDFSDEGSNLPIGKPLKNIEFKILPDKKKSNQGELVIGGPQLMLGYTNKSHNDCYVEIEGKKYFKTGDIVSVDCKGIFTFLGRKDEVVKIFGEKLSIQELSNELCKNIGISKVIFESTGDKSYPEINLFVECDGIIKERDIVEILRKKYKRILPVVTIFTLDQFPLLKNGKLDIHKIKESINLKNEKHNQEIKKNDDSIKENLLIFWKSRLCLNHISDNDSFLNLGGNSLKFFELMAFINSQFNLNIEITELFESPTLISQVQLISKALNRNSSTEIQILKIAHNNALSLSPQQKKIWFLSREKSSSIAYNNFIKYTINGKFDIQRFTNSFQKTIERHESLRTIFEEIHGETKQTIKKYFDIDSYFIFTDLSYKSTVSSDQIFNTEVNYSFELNKGALCRLHLIKISNDAYELVICMHHIISDGVSFKILIDDLFDFYFNKKLPEHDFQYKDYSEWINSQLKYGVYSNQKDYWLSKFKNYTVSTLPIDYIRPDKKTYEGNSLFFELPEFQNILLIDFCKNQEITVFNFLLSVYYIFLFKITDSTAHVVGVPFAGRGKSEFDKLIGMFVNTIPFNYNLSNSSSFRELCLSMKEEVLKAFKNQEYPFEDLAQKLNIEHSYSNNAIFNIMFAMQESPEVRKFKDFTIEPEIIYNRKTSMFDLILEAFEMKNEINFRFEYNTGLFKESTIKRFIKYYKRVISIVLDNPELEIHKIDILDDEDRDVLLNKFNDTKLKLPQQNHIHELIEYQAIKHINCVAIEDINSKISYAELIDKSKDIANTLRGLGIKRNELVAINIERSIDMVISMIGVLMADAGFICLDGELPENRKNYILADSNPKFIINRKTYASTHSNRNELKICKNNSFKSTYSDAIVNDLAYAIYTSGTTGTPKGMMIGHKSVINFLNSLYNTFEKKITPADNCLSITNISFDVSICEIFLPLIFGSKLIIAQDSDRFLPEKLSSIIIDQQISFTYIPPSLLNDVCVSMKKGGGDIKLNKLLVGVEPINMKVLDEYNMLINNIQIINGYGPSETTICSTFFKYIANSNNTGIVPIGKPIGNTKVYILDSNQEIVPIGCEGEIYISGEGLSLGYINSIELNKQKFITTHWSKERLYRTGDFAKWMEDGNIMFIGRKDNQVKIRGYRIELGDIEAKLGTYPGVSWCKVLTKNDKLKDKILCAFYKADIQLSEQLITESLENQIPNYMVPTIFKQIDEIPQTVNGKVDYKKLINDLEFTSKTIVKPHTELEIKLSAIWSEILGIDKEKISIDDSFFSLGGHSLKVMKLSHIIFKEFQVEIKQSLIFSNPVLKDLANLIDNAKVNANLTGASIDEIII